MKTLKLIIEFPVAAAVLMFVGFDLWRRYLRRRKA
jgi:hypothetical protein